MLKHRQGKGLLKFKKEAVWPRSCENYLEQLPSHALCFFGFFFGLHLQLSPHLHSGPHGQFLPSLQAAVLFVSQAIPLIFPSILQGAPKAKAADMIDASSSFFNISYTSL